MLLLSNMELNTGTVALFQSFTIFSGFFTYNYCGLIFCLAEPLTGKCSGKIVRLKVAKLRLNLGMLSQIWDWIFSLILSPVITNKGLLWIVIYSKDTLCYPAFEQLR